MGSRTVFDRQVSCVDRTVMSWNITKMAIYCSIHNLPCMNDRFVC